MSKYITSKTENPNNSISFSFGCHTLHAFERDGEAFFLASKVAEALGYADPDQAIRKHCKSAEILKPVDLTALNLPHKSPRGLTTIPERDLYRLILRSKLPTAEAFEEKVVGEVLPAIRKTGSYSVAPQIPRTLSEALRLAADQAEQIDALQPKAEAFEKLASLEGCHNLRSSAQQCGWDERLFIQRLIELRWLYKSPVTGRKYAYADKIKAGLMDVKNVEVHRTGYTEGVGQPLITQDGLTRLKLILGVQPGKKATLRPFTQAVERTR